MKEGGGSFLSSPPPPRLLAPFFAWPLLQNSTETLASQASPSLLVRTSFAANVKHLSLLYGGLQDPRFWSNKGFNL